MSDEKQAKQSEAQKQAQDDLCFDLRLQERPVKITHPDGTVEHCTLREIDGSQRVLYMNMMTTKVKSSADGKSGSIVDFTNVETGLIAMCLYDSKHQLVKSENINKFPSRVQSKLYEACCTLCGLGDDVAARKEAKND